MTRRSLLFVNPTHTHGFEGMADDEGLRLIEELRDHATQDRFAGCRGRAARRAPDHAADDRAPVRSLEEPDYAR